MEKRQFILYHKLISSRFNAFLNEWDFLGVVPLGVNDECIDLIGPVLAELQVNNDKQSLIRFVKNIVTDRYGIAPSGVEKFITSVLLWWAQQTIEVNQRDIASGYKTNFTPAAPLAMVGVSDNTDGKLTPINGLRHPVEENSSGWFIWSGEKFSEDKNFFKPTHVMHLKEKCPQVFKFLGLPPGYRFLIDNNGYIDVWYDDKLII